MKKMKANFGARGTVTMPEIALTTLARQKFDATGNFGANMAVGAVIGSDKPDEEHID